MTAFTYKQSLEAYKKAMGRAGSAPRFGYKSLDKMIPGLLPGQLTVLAGATSMGKTTFTANCAYLMAKKQEKKVLFFSLESGHAIANVIEKLSGEKDLHNIRIITPETRLTLSQVRKEIEENLHNAEVVFLDHLHYLLPSGNEQMQAKIGVLVRDIQLMAKQLEIPIILICHVRKLQTETAIPGLNDLKDSSSLYQDPSIVLIIHRFKKEILDVAVGDEQMFKNNGLLVIGKNRDFGKTGTLKIDFDPDSLAFAVAGEWPCPQPVENMTIAQVKEVVSGY